MQIPLSSDNMFAIQLSLEGELLRLLIHLCERIGRDVSPLLYPVPEDDEERPVIVESAGAEVLIVIYVVHQVEGIAQRSLRPWRVANYISLRLLCAFRLPEKGALSWKLSSN